MKRSGRRKFGFTLIELLVVVSIIVIVVSIMLPSLTGARGHARAVICQSNLHHLGIATNMYLDKFKGNFWRYYQNEPGGRQWWFGYEAGGPASGTNRSLDLSRSALAEFMTSDADRFQCPDFAYDHQEFFPKFEKRSASYGFNLNLGPASMLFPTKRRRDYPGREAEVFVFSDAIHFDFNPGFNEGHYVQFTPNVSALSGYSHFRHLGSAQYVFMDGHVGSQQLDGFSHKFIAGGDAGNLVAPDGTPDIYGF